MNDNFNLLGFSNKDCIDFLSAFGYCASNSSYNEKNSTKKDSLVIILIGILGKTITAFGFLSFLIPLLFSSNTVFWSFFSPLRREVSSVTTETAAVSVVTEETRVYVSGWKPRFIDVFSASDSRSIIKAPRKVQLDRTNILEREYNYDFLNHNQPRNLFWYLIPPGDRPAILTDRFVSNNIPRFMEYKEVQPLLPPVVNRVCIDVNHRVPLPCIPDGQELLNPNQVVSWVLDFNLLPLPDDNLIET